MILFNNILEKIDNFYKKRSKKDHLYSYLLSILIPGFIIFITSYDFAKNIYNKAKREHDKTLRSINEKENYLKINSEDSIFFIKQNNKLLKKEFTKIKYMTNYIENKISELSPMIYNETAWGSFMDSISDSAKANNIHLYKLKNLFIKKQDRFGHVLNLELKFSGNFYNTLNFINSFEKRDLIVDVYDIQITSNKNLYSKLKVAVWGINY